MKYKIIVKSDNIFELSHSDELFYSEKVVEAQNEQDARAIAIKEAETIDSKYLPLKIDITQA